MSQERRLSWRIVSEKRSNKFLTWRGRGLPPLTFNIMPLEWKQFTAESCPKCGALPEVLTDAEDAEEPNDGDHAVCPNCSLEGAIAIEEEGQPYILWDEDNF